MQPYVYFNRPIHSSLNCIEQPSEECIDLELAKLHAKVEVDADDDLFPGLIASARRYSETHQRRALLESTWRYTLDFFPHGFSSHIALPIPATAINEITYFDGSDFVTLDPSRYVADTASNPARIFPNYGQTWPTMTWRRPNSVVVEFDAGYGVDAVPKSTVQAMLMLVGGWYAQREHISDVSLMEVPAAVDRLLDFDCWGGGYFA